MILTKNKTHKLDSELFFDAVTGNKIKERTEIYLQLTDFHIIVSFTCLDNPYIKDNTYNIDNSDLFKQEVFEIFIAQGIDDPYYYLEIEINPLGAIFIANIYNNDLIGTNLKREKINKKHSGITSEVKKYNDYWKGKISIPLELIKQKDLNYPNDYRINFYRIISGKSHKDPNWENNSKESIYACWKCTHSPDKPKFHRSKYFGNLRINL